MEPAQVTPNPNSYVPPATGSQSNLIPQAPTPPATVAPLDQTQIASTDSNGDNPYLASQMMSYMNSKMTSVNSLNTVRNAMIQSRFSQNGLTPQEISSLDPNTQAIINSGNKGLQEMYLQSVNDQIQGYSNSLSSNMTFIQTGYQQAIQNAETQKNDAISSITAVLNAGGTPQAIEALKKLFPGQADLINAFDPNSQSSGLGQYSTLTVDPSDQASMGKLSNAISSEESGGSYTAIGGGEKTPSANTALGKYQIVPSDWFSSITNPATGKPLDPNNPADLQLFLSNPQLQDQAFSTVIGSYLQKNGNNLPQAIASYFAGSNGKYVGTPLGDTITDKASGGPGTSINQYVSNVLSAYTGGQVNIGSGSTPTQGNNTDAQGNPVNLPPTSNPNISLAEQLVKGTLAPSQLSKRSTGPSSYNAIIAEAQKLDPNFNAETADQNFAYGKSEQTQSTQAALSYTVDTLKQLSSLSANIDRGNITFGNKAGQWLNYNGSDPATVAFITKANGAVDDISAALGGGVSTDTKTAIAQSIMNPTLSDAAFQAQLATNLGTIASRQVNISQQSGKTANPTELSIFATAQGYNYAAMQSAGYTDAQIQAALLKQ